MKIPTYVNRVTFKAIPINKDLKRYLLMWYVRLTEHNGPKYAADRLKAISELCLAYRADPQRLAKVNDYVRKIPLSHKGWVRAILKCMDTHPMHMLNLLKIYVGPRPPLVTVEESAQQQKQYLDTRRERVKTQTPPELSLWLSFVKARSIDEARNVVNIHSIIYNTRKWSDLTKAHTIEELEAYRRKWHYLLFRKWHVNTAEDMIESVRTERFPFPEVYKDFSDRDKNSATLDSDLYNLALWYNIVQEHWDVKLPLSPNLIRYIVSVSGFDPIGFREAIDFIPQIDDPMSKTFMVGDIHHIPKKGTIKRRPIGVPNRFVQMGLLPAQHLLENILRNLPKDCTFDQDRFDRVIASRVSSPSLYVGSVDLSQATDNLPLKWGRDIIDTILKFNSFRLPKIYNDSWACFLEAAQAMYYNSGYPTKWTVGQPLGTLPSFDLLGITHNCVLEALAFSRRLLHSPYCVLGDDLLVFNKKLRFAYIKLMQGHGIPLSLHKSYQGNLVEFAGKIYIRNQIPAYRTDQLAITWESLFDWQRATGIPIEWKKLPLKLQKKCQQAIMRLLSDHPKRFPEQNPKALAMDFAPRAYTLASQALVLAHGSQDRLHNQQFIDRAAAFYILLEDQDSDPVDQQFASPVFRFGNEIISMQRWMVGTRSGHRFRYMRKQLPGWYRTKFRPNTSSMVIQCAFRSLVDWK